jgi:hypothetical protein
MRGNKRSRNLPPRFLPLLSPSVSPHSILLSAPFITKINTVQGIIPVIHDVEEQKKKQADGAQFAKYQPVLMGQVAGAINVLPSLPPSPPPLTPSPPPFLFSLFYLFLQDIRPAADIINDMVHDAVTRLQQSTALISPRAKL